MPIYNFLFGRRKLLWRLYISYIVIVFLSLMAASWFAYGSLKQFYLDETREHLHVRAELVARMIGRELSESETGAIDGVCKEVGREINTRITVILPDGVVVGDSDQEYEIMDNHGNRPEILDALSGNMGVSTRHSATLEKDLMYVALPVEVDSKIAAVVRVSMPLASIDTAVNKIKIKVALIVMLIALAAAIISYMASRWIDRPIKTMIRGVERFAGGDLKYRITTGSADELGQLAESINTMAAELDERVRIITDQRAELEAILSGMVEAIIVVDDTERIIEHNHAAERYFHSVGQARGKHIVDMIGNTKIHDFVRRTLSQTGFVEDEIVIREGDGFIVQAHGTQFYDASREHVGAIVVLNDITRIKKLENMRREFVANVSHELKTPITSIIGFVETLNDGAVEDVEVRQQFLDIILKHGRRLNAIIEDLLSISRLEQDSEHGRIVLSPSRLSDIVKNAVSLCEPEASTRKIKLTMECEDIMVKSNAQLLEQAVVNLIDNAIKYSEPDNSVVIRGFRAGNDAVIEVKDFGCGIPEDSLPRIFERFYRVDKGRSRARGGTGLGLSIVKHIVNAHNGKVDVKSVVDKGSTFTIILPVI